MKKTGLSYYVFTDTGDRQVNEDNAAVAERDGRFCFVLCDGLGGHGMGDIASSSVADSFIQMFNSAEYDDCFLSRAFDKAQQVLMTERIKLSAGLKMKTTAVALVTDEKYARIGHIGDSRLYVFKSNRVKCRTIDHSVPQMLALSRQIKESEIRNHPERNILLRVMGDDWESPMYELMPAIELKRCQAFLLCSDGFWELIDEKAMCSLLKKASSPEEWMNNMVEMVRENGKDRCKDNYTAIAIWP